MDFYLCFFKLYIVFSHFYNITYSLGAFNMPIIIHGSWVPNSGESFINCGKFFIWLEDTEISFQPKNNEELLVFSCQKMEVLEGFGLNISTKSWETIDFIIPTLNDKPLNSVNINKYLNNPAINLNKWQVPGIFLDVTETFQFLLFLQDFEKAPEKLIFGDDLIFWISVASYAKGLVKSQQFLPDIIKGPNHEYYAIWRFAGDIIAFEKNLITLTQQMPGICQCIFPGYDPKGLIKNFISIMLDHLVRNVKTSKIIEIILRAFPNHIEADFINALIATDIRPIDTSANIDEFFDQFKQWQDSHQRSYASLFRLCFKLEEPKNEDEPWIIRFLLQSKNDSNILFMAEDVWQQENNLIYKLCKNPREVLLENLGRASEIYPPLLNCLDQEQPHLWELTAEDAYDFLKNGAGLLEEKGFGILVPAWWKSQNKQKIGLKLKLGSKDDKIPPLETGLMGLDAIVDYDIFIAIGDEEIPASQWQQLVDMKVPLVNIKGQWVEIQKSDVEHVLNLWTRKKDRDKGKMPLLDALSLASGGLGDEALQQVQTQGWFERLLKDLEKPDSFQVARQPRGFCGKLRDYQKRGMSWLMYLEKRGLSGCLADDMGLGKTIQVLALLLNEKENKGSTGPTLLICPTSVIRNWKKEAERFTPSLSILVHYSPERLRGKDFENQVKQKDLIITSFNIARRDFKELNKIKWQRIIVDEAQNIKNPTSKQTKAIKSLQAKTRIALTGTPVENRLAELWSIMDFLNPGYLGSFNYFRKNFELPIQKHEKTEPLVRLKKLVKPFLLRRVKTDSSIIKDLPEKQEIKVYCPLTKEQASLYEAVVKDTLEKLNDSDGIRRRGIILASLTKLKQICNHPAQFLKDRNHLASRSGKLTRLSEMLYEATAESESTLIFTQFRQMGEILKSYLDKTFEAEVFFLHGGIPTQDRNEMVRRFQEETDPKIFILSLKAGGVGLNLTKANHVFHFDRWWNPAVENQATDRAFRIGQNKNVQVYKYICQGTLEERIDELISKKQELVDNVVTSGESWLTELDNNQIADLITLSRQSAIELD